MLGSRCTLAIFSMRALTRRRSYPLGTRLRTSLASAVHLTLKPSKASSSSISPSFVAAAIMASLSTRWKVVPSQTGHASGCPPRDGRPQRRHSQVSTSAAGAWAVVFLWAGSTPMARAACSGITSATA